MLMRSLLITAAVAAAGLLAGPASVAAHADYESSVPGANEVVAESPARVDVFFTQDVLKIEGQYHVRVFDAEGTLIAGDGTVDDDDRAHVFTELSEPLAEGLHVVEWFTTSDTDGDTDEGSFCFSVVVPLPEPLPEACQEEPPEPTPTVPAATETASESQSTPAPTQADQGDAGDDGVSAGLIVGVVVGLVAVVIVAGGAFVWLRRPRA